MAASLTLKNNLLLLWFFLSSFISDLRKKIPPRNSTTKECCTFFHNGCVFVGWFYFFTIVFIFWQTSHTYLKCEHSDLTSLPFWGPTDHSDLCVLFCLFLPYFYIGRTSNCFKTFEKNTYVLANTNKSEKFAKLYKSMRKIGAEHFHMVQLHRVSWACWTWRENLHTKNIAQC